VVLDEQGQHVSTEQFSHTVDGLAQLTALRVEHGRDGGAASGSGVQHGNLAWSPDGRLARGGPAGLSSPSQDGGSPSPTRLSLKRMPSLPICWRGRDGVIWPICAGSRKRARSFRS
jgi:hypothetical protein